MNTLIDFINSLTEGQSHTIAPETELIESGIIDSLNIAQLITYIEKRTGRAVPLEDLNLDDIKTPASILNTYFVAEGV